MKIAYILPSLANMGPILVVKDLVSFLKDKAEITVYYFDPIIETSFDCPTVNIKFFDKIDLSGYDILHSHMLRPDAFLYLNRKRIRGKCVSTMHSYVEPDLKNTYNAFTSFVFTKVWNMLVSKHDMLVTLSKHMMAYYQTLYSNKNVSYVYNGRNIEPDSALTIPEGDLNLIKGFKKGGVLLGVSALLTNIKGIDQTIKLLAKMPDLKLLIIGDGPAKEELMDLAITEGVNERCLFLGYRTEGHRYNSLFDIYALTSRSEGFPLAMIEAAAYGVPILASDLPIFKEAFDSNEISFYRLEDIEDMKSATERLIKDIGTYSNNILARYKKDYTAKQMASGYLEIYKSLLKIEV